MRYILAYIALLFSFSMVFGQKLNCIFDKLEVQIGEPFTLTLSVVSSEEISSISYSPYSGIFPARNSVGNSANGTSSSYELEILTDFSDTSYIENGEYIWKGKYEMIAWDSANVVVTPEKIYLNDSLYYFPANLLLVSSPTADPSKPIYDIYEVFTELEKESFLKKNGWWLAIVGGVLILGLLFLFIKNKPKKVEVPLSLRQLTLKRIDALEEGKGYEENLKEYYYDLSIILRRFFAQHYKAPIMDKTTLEIEEVLAKHGLHREMVQLTRQLLTQSDMVKFAKSKPSIQEIILITNDARRVVNEVADLDLKVNE